MDFLIKNLKEELAGLFALILLYRQLVIFLKKGDKAGVEHSLGLIDEEEKRRLSAFRKKYTGTEE